MNTSTKSTNPYEVVILSNKNSLDTHKLNCFTKSSYISKKAILANKKPVTNNNEISDFKEKIQV